jgi:hypothetical protein
MPSSSPSDDRGPGQGRPVAPKPQTPVPPRPGAKPATRRAPRRTSARQSIVRARQQRLYLAGGLVAVIVVAAAVLVSVSFIGNGKAAPPSQSSIGEFALPPGAQSAVEAVPTAKLVAAALSKNKYAAPLQALPANNKVLKKAGKPAIIYIGADSCPYCAGERWALVMALSKFGTFSKLMGTSSSAVDINPSTPTFSFYGSKYSSPYISFEPVETTTNKYDPSIGSYGPLQQPTAFERSLYSKWDRPPYTTQAGGIPFVYLGGRYLLTGGQYDASKIAGWQMLRAAEYMTAGTNPTSLGAEAAAGYLVGEICSLTHDRPARVCAAVPAGLKR